TTTPWLELDRRSPGSTAGSSLPRAAACFRSLTGASSSCGRSSRSLAMAPCTPSSRPRSPGALPKGTAPCPISPGSWTPCYHCRPNKKSPAVVTGRKAKRGGSIRSRGLTRAAETHNAPADPCRRDPRRLAPLNHDADSRIRPDALEWTTRRKTADRGISHAYAPACGQRAEISQRVLARMDQGMDRRASAPRGRRRTAGGGSTSAEPGARLAERRRDFSDGSRDRLARSLPGEDAADPRRDGAARRALA